MNPFIPLVGPDQDKPAKSPAERGWASSEYRGVDRTYGGWVGMRCDDLVVVDCDNAEAAKAWTKAHPEPTFVVKTPRGFHFYYEHLGEPLGPHVAVVPGTDIRSGPGSYVVVPPTPGYEVVKQLDMATYNPAWFKPRESKPESGDEGWTEVPEGQRNSMLASLGGMLRKQGADFTVIFATLLGFNESMCVPPLPRDEVRVIARSVAGYEPDPDLVLTDEEVDAAEAQRYIRASELELPPPQEWWWKPYFPKGQLVMLDGAEGIGKGLMCVWLAVASLKGLPLAPGQPALEPAPVLWYSAEDDPQSAILRRLMAAGWDPKTDEDVVFWNPRTARPRAPQQANEFLALAERVRPRFIIMDPGRSFLAPPAKAQGNSLNDEAVIRPGMEALMQLGYETGATIVFVHHWNKRSDGSMRERSGGSGAFQQVVRHKLVVAKIGDVRAFGADKSNLSDTNHSVWGFAVEEDTTFEEARFVLGKPLVEHETMDAWWKAAKEAHQDVQLKDPVTWDVVAKHFNRTLAVGDPAPSLDDVIEALDCTEPEAHAAMAALREIDVITKDGTWGFVP